MRKILHYLRDFIREDFHFGTYLMTAALLALALTLNYTFGIADSFVYRVPDGAGKLLRWMAFMAVPYLVVLGLQAIFIRGYEGPKQIGFWISCLMAILMVSVTAWFPYHKTLAKQLFPPELTRWGMLVLWNLKRFVFMLLPMLIYWLAVDRSRSRFYGFLTKPSGLGPYFLILAILSPLIILASFQPDFLRSYPQYHAGAAEAKIGVSPWLTGIVFEFVYGADFALVELLFRGFLVIGMVRWLGPRAVLPMVAMYCVLHFGKPAGEAVASIFGGYILGVIAYYSRSIWSGIVLHMGIAWMMELAAYLQKMGQ